MTTARIMGRSVPRMAGLIAWDRAARGIGLVTRTGDRQVPLSIAAATLAWLSGLTRSVPCPNASAATSTGWRGVVNFPSVAGMPRLGVVLKPNVAAIDASAGPPSRWKASMAKVELHDTANAVCRLVMPRC